MKKVFLITFIIGLNLFRVYSQVIEEKHFKTIYSARAALINYYEFSPDSKYLLICASNYARVYEWPSGKLYYTLTHSTDKDDNVYKGKFSPNGEYVATFGMNKINIWDLDQKKRVENLENITWIDPNYNLRDSLKLTYRFDCYIQTSITNSQNKIRATTLNSNDSNPRVVKIDFYNKNNKIIQSIDFNGKLFGAYYPNGVFGCYLNEKNKIETAYRMYPAIVFSPDGKYFLIGNAKGNTYVYNVIYK